MLVLVLPFIEGEPSFTEASHLLLDLLEEDRPFIAIGLT
jgi:hypothetical protein